MEAVQDEIVQANQVNESQEDSSYGTGGGAPIAEEVTDTVAYAESKAEEVGTETYYTAKVNSDGYLLLSDGTVTPYKPQYDGDTDHLTGAVRRPGQQRGSGAGQPAGALPGRGGGTAAAGGGGGYLRTHRPE